MKLVQSAPCPAVCAAKLHGIRLRLHLQSAPANSCMNWNGSTLRKTPLWFIWVYHTASWKVDWSNWNQPLRKALHQWVHPNPCNIGESSTKTHIRILLSMNKGLHVAVMKLCCWYRGDELHSGILLGSIFGRHRLPSDYSMESVKLNEGAWKSFLGPLENARSQFWDHWLP